MAFYRLVGLLVSPSREFLISARMLAGKRLQHG